MTTGTTVDVALMDENLDLVAKNIVDKWLQWDMARGPWKAEKLEIRNYIYATDTRKTTNSKLPWKNSTTLPKICQIADNLHANYMAAAFPHSDWLSWEPGDRQAATVEKRDVVLAYMKNKLYLSKYRSTVSQLFQDWIHYGNAFVMNEWVNDSKVDPITQEAVQGYIGPRAVRISPMDIVFNPIASRFEDSPKIVRSYKSLGEIRRMIDKTVNETERAWMQAAFDKCKELRRRVCGIQPEDMPVNNRLAIDGFGSFWQYLQSGTVEILTFYGDFYDQDSDTMYEDYRITVMDRLWCLQKTPIPGWIARNAVRHCGWRPRQDNLWAMGPLDNLIGMQYRIDHLENLKADAFDMVAFPMTKIKGFVSEFEYGPNERIVCGDDGDVEFMNPPVQMLAADNQIEFYENKMEEMAGAPKQAMGFRTPGEKTAYEVQSLENAAGRIFQNRISFFEENLMEPNINDQLELSRRNMQENETIKVFNDQYSVNLFREVTKEDITASGKIQPRGAAQYIRRNILLQNLSNFLNSAFAQDEAVKVHLSTIGSAKAFSELLGLNDYNIVTKNIRLSEMADMDAAKRELQNQLVQEQMTDTEGGVQGNADALLGLPPEQEQEAPQ